LSCILNIIGWRQSGRKANYCTYSTCALACRSPRNLLSDELIPSLPFHHPSAPADYPTQVALARPPTLLLSLICSASPTPNAVLLLSVIHILPVRHRERAQRESTERLCQCSNSLQLPTVTPTRFLCASLWALRDKTVGLIASTIASPRPESAYTAYLRHLRTSCTSSHRYL
jgi:hypothetical protein